MKTNNYSYKYKYKSFKPNQSGFSLTELLVSQALLIITLSVFQTSQSNLFILMKQQHHRMHAYWQAEDLAARILLSEHAWRLKRQELEKSQNKETENSAQANIQTILLSTQDIKQWNNNFKLEFENYQWDMSYIGGNWSLLVYESDQDGKVKQTVFQKDLFFDR